MLLPPLKPSTPTILWCLTLTATADIKAMSDIICTSSNARQFDSNKFLQTSRLFLPPTKTWGATSCSKPGAIWCYGRAAASCTKPFLKKNWCNCRSSTPTPILLPTRNVEPAVLRHADYVGSTTALLKYAQQSPKHEFIVVTEPGIIHQMQKTGPQKTVYFRHRPPPPVPVTSALTCGSTPSKNFIWL